jgi:hypothetical protein
METQMKLVWKKRPWPSRYGIFYDLTGLPNNGSNSAIAYYRPGSKDYIANACISGLLMTHIAGTMQAAIKRLNNEIDRRSIGLFDLDDINITYETKGANNA